LALDKKIIFFLKKGFDKLKKYYIFALANAISNLPL
jgi:hypothetical protein